MKQPHKHAEIIKQWADDINQIVQVMREGCGWQDLPVTPSWSRDLEYRIKPDPRAARDMAIAKAVESEARKAAKIALSLRHECLSLDLEAIIASVKD